MNSMIRLIGDISCFIWKKLASLHVPKVTTVLYQVHPNLALHVVVHLNVMLSLHPIVFIMFAFIVSVVCGLFWNTHSLK